MIHPCHLLCMWQTSTLHLQSYLNSHIILKSLISLPQNTSHISNGITERQKHTSHIFFLPFVFPFFFFTIRVCGFWMAVCHLLKTCCVSEEFNVKWFCQWNLAPPWAVLPVCSEIQRWNIPGKQSLRHCLAWGIHPSRSSSSHLSPAAVISRRGLIASGLRCRIALAITMFLFLVYFFYLPVFLYALDSRERMNRYISIFTWYVVSGS